jgi:hypothetical protein
MAKNRLLSLAVLVVASVVVSGCTGDASTRAASVVHFSIEPNEAAMRETKPKGETKKAVKTEMYCEEIKVKANGFWQEK